ncbi:hypothetical protein [Curtobacterium sp. ISL-83]|uniref:hypothetical protein n=1 Tax=Curtobacterium sp. ISL-83 TaxID=2819145 RepID=UPI0035AB7594
MGATFDLLTEPGSTPVCSRAGCTATATWRINWRNPRIHAIDRVKIWAACDEHRDFLADYLRSRSFPVRVTGMHEDVDHLDDVRVIADGPKNDVGVRASGTDR